MHSSFISRAAAAFAPPSVQPAAILRCLLCERLSSPHYDVTRGPAFSPLREPGELPPILTPQLCLPSSTLLRSRANASAKSVAVPIALSPNPESPVSALSCCLVSVRPALRRHAALSTVLSQSPVAAIVRRVSPHAHDEILPVRILPLVSMAIFLLLYRDAPFPGFLFRA